MKNKKCRSFERSEKASTPHSTPLDEEKKIRRLALKPMNLMSEANKVNDQGFSATPEEENKKEEEYKLGQGV